MSIFLPVSTTDETEPSIAQIAQYRRSADSSSTVAITLVI